MSVMRAARMCVCVCGWRAGCVPLLVHLIHDINDGSNSGGSSAVTDHDAETATRARAAAALHNVVTAAAAALSGVDDETSRHEVRVLRLLEQVRAYCDQLRRRPAAAAADDTPPLHVPGEMPPSCRLLSWSRFEHTCRFELNC